MDYGSDYNRDSYASDPTDADMNPTQQRKMKVQEPDIFETVQKLEDTEKKGVSPPSADAPVPRITTASSSMFDQLIGNSITANAGVSKSILSNHSTDAAC